MKSTGWLSSWTLRRSILSMSIISLKIFPSVTARNMDRFEVFFLFRRQVGVQQNTA